MNKEELPIKELFFIYCYKTSVLIKFYLYTELCKENYERRQNKNIMKTHKHPSNNQKFYCVSLPD